MPQNHRTAHSRLADRCSNSGEKSQRRESQQKEDQTARKSREVANHCVFSPMFYTSGGSKSRLATAAGAEPFGGMRDQKLHVVVVRSKFGSQNGKNTSALEHFWSWSS